MAFGGLLIEVLQESSHCLDPGSNYFERKQRITSEIVVIDVRRVLIDKQNMYIATHIALTPRILAGKNTAMVNVLRKIFIVVDMILLK